VQRFVEKVAPWIIVLAAVPTVIVLAKQLANPVRG
jgi:hypothetical protein